VGQQRLLLLLLLLLMMIEGAGAGDSSFLRRSLTASFRFSSILLGLNALEQYEKVTHQST
jgi:hypothetical protein